MRVSNREINPSHVVMIAEIGPSNVKGQHRYRVVLSGLEGEMPTVSWTPQQAELAIAEWAPVVPAGPGYFAVEMVDDATDPDRWETAYELHPVLAWRCQEGGAVPILLEDGYCIDPAVLTPEGVVVEPYMARFESLEAYVRSKINERTKAAA